MFGTKAKGNRLRRRGDYGRRKGRHGDKGWLKIHKSDDGSHKLYIRTPDPY